MIAPASEILLIPRPASVRRVRGTIRVPPEALAWRDDAPFTMTPGGGWLDEHVGGGWCGADEREAQGYRLRVGASARGEFRVRLDAPSRAGLRHGRATLVQLLRQFPAECPGVEIDDRPEIVGRGVMLDVSRCRVPTMAEFGRIIDQLAGLKCNHLQVYTEHTFAYAGHESVWTGWSPITPDEARSLDAACREQGIELAANQNCFGHLRQWLERPEYAHLAETHGDWMFDVWPRSGPFSLCPTDPASLDLVHDLLGQLLPCFASGLVNIGCDETYDIAHGRSAAAVRERGRGVVFAEFVAKVAAAASRHGKRSMFWADIALSHPECLALLPADAVPLAWGYESDAPWEKWCAALRGREYWLCPGTSSWRSLTGRTSERRANIDGAVRAAVEHAAAGVLVCDWGDSGHWQPWPLALHGIADGLATTWEGPAAPAGPAAGPLASHLAAESLHLLDDPTHRVAGWLETFGDADLPLREVCLPLSRPGVEGRLRNQTAVFADLFQPWDALREVGGVERWREVNDVLAQMERERPPTRDALVNAELASAASMASLAAARGAARRGIAYEAARREMPAAWEQIEREFRTLWLRRSRPGGLPQACEFFRKVGW